jgi:hypothetical protein
MGITGVFKRRLYKQKEYYRAYGNDDNQAAERETA